MKYKQIESMLEIFYTSNTNDIDGKWNIIHHSHPVRTKLQNLLAYIYTSCAIIKYD